MTNNLFSRNCEETKWKL